MGFKAFGPTEQKIFNCCSVRLFTFKQRRDPLAGIPASYHHLDTVIMRSSPVKLTEICYVCMYV